LSAPKTEATRPTTDANRETIFNVLLHGYGFEPRHALDLFAGSGALGLEALSAGAQTVVFVESERAAVQAIEKNATSLGAPTTAWRIVRNERIHEWGAQLKKCGESFVPFDLVFCDPPYEERFPERTFRALEKTPEIFAPGALLCVEISTREAAPELPAGWKALEQRSRGTTQLLFYRRGE